MTEYDDDSCFCFCGGSVFAANGIRIVRDFGCIHVESMFVVVYDDDNAKYTITKLPRVQCVAIGMSLRFVMHRQDPYYLLLLLLHPLGVSFVVYMGLELRNKPGWTILYFWVSFFNLG
jgi:hypothetical protein